MIPKYWLYQDWKKMLKDNLESELFYWNRNVFGDLTYFVRTAWRFLPQKWL